MIGSYRQYDLHRLRVYFSSNSVLFLNQPILSSRKTTTTSYYHLSWVSIDCSNLPHLCNLFWYHTHPCTLIPQHLTLVHPCRLFIEMLIWTACMWWGDNYSSRDVSMNLRVRVFVCAVCARANKNGGRKRTSASRL